MVNHWASEYKGARKDLLYDLDFKSLGKSLWELGFTPDWMLSGIGGDSIRGFILISWGWWRARWRLIMVKSQQSLLLAGRGWVCISVVRTVTFSFCFDETVSWSWLLFYLATITDNFVWCQCLVILLISSRRTPWSSCEHTSVPNNHTASRYVAGLSLESGIAFCFLGPFFEARTDEFRPQDINSRCEILLLVIKRVSPTPHQ